MLIYFNPACSKCNEALELLNSNSCDVEIRNYLADPPTVGELKDLVKKLGCKPLDLVRTKETLFQEQFAGKEIADEEILQMLSENPILIERPIVVAGDEAIIGRPPSLVLKFAKDQD